MCCGKGMVEDEVRGDRVVELSGIASIFCQGNTITSVTRPPTTRQARGRERERAKGEEGLNDLEAHTTNDSGYPKRLKLGLLLLYREYLYY